MNILLISNGYPSKELPFGSLYVKNHFERLSEVSSYAVDKHVILRKDTSFIRSIMKYLWCFISFAKKMPKHYDVIHVHFLSPVYLLAYLYKLRKPTCRIVLTFHGSDINELYNSQLIKFYQYLLKKNEVSIAVGEELKKRAEELLKIKVNYVLPAGFNDNTFYDKGYSYEQREIDFLYVGSFLPVKGLDTVIETIKKLDDFNMKFVFVGTGSLESELQELTEKYNVEVIQGLPQKKLNDIYNNSRFFILPSRKEGFGLALTEAMFCGCPGIIRDIPQLRHQITTGKNGFIFQDSDELVSIINNCNLMDSEDWNELSEFSKINSREYSLSNVINLMMEIYHK